MFGKPVIAGTRIPVEIVLEKLAIGETIATISFANKLVKKVSVQDDQTNLYKISPLIYYNNR